MDQGQAERYSRHIALPEIGAAGQERLLAARVLVVGAGGLGSPAAMYLAAAGVGTIGIADFDAVSLSNLQRQVIHSTGGIGRPKTESAALRIAALNPGVKVERIDAVIDASNARETVRAYDFAIDATDNFAAKFLLNDACVMERKPFSHAGALRFSGQTFTYVPGVSPCLRCILGGPPAKGARQGSCGRDGVLGSLCGVIGSVQAAEAVKWITGAGKPLSDRLLCVDLLEGSFRTAALPPRDPACPVCGDRPSILAPVDTDDCPVRLSARQI